MISCGNQQKKVNKGITASSKIESVITLEAINKTHDSIENNAVIYRSNNMGVTWSSFAKGIPADATLSGIKQHGNKVYVTTDYHGVFVASNGLDNWTALNAVQLKGLDINCIEVEAEKIVIGTLRQGIFISNDAGLNWKQPKSNIENSSIRAFIKSKINCMLELIQVYLNQLIWEIPGHMFLDDCRFLVLPL